MLNETSDEIKGHKAVLHLYVVCVLRIYAPDINIQYFISHFMINQIFIIKKHRDKQKHVRTLHECEYMSNDKVNDDE